MHVDGHVAGGDGTSNNNSLTYEVSGSDILIQGYDANSDQAAPEATNFRFAFIDFQNQPTPADTTNALARPMAVANFAVADNGGNNAAPTITRLTTSDDSFEFIPNNRGDNRPFIDGGRTTAQGGVMLTRVSDDFRDNTGIIVDKGDETADPVVPPCTCEALREYPRVTELQYLSITNLPNFRVFWQAGQTPTLRLSREPGGKTAPGVSTVIVRFFHITALRPHFCRLHPPVELPYSFRLPGYSQLAQVIFRKR